MISTVFFKWHPVLCLTLQWAVFADKKLNDFLLIFEAKFVLLLHFRIFCKIQGLDFIYDHIIYVALHGMFHSPLTIAIPSYRTIAALPPEVDLLPVAALPPDVALLPIAASPLFAFPF